MDNRLTAASEQQSNHSDFKRRRQLMDHAERLGRICGSCGRSLANEEAATIVRFARDNSDWPRFVGRAPVCMDCASLPMNLRPIQFKAIEGRQTTMPCEGCGRPVTTGIAPLQTRILCSRTCGAKANRPPAGFAERTCCVCGKPYKATRWDSRTCGPTCRKRSSRATVAKLAPKDYNPVKEGVGPSFFVEHPTIVEVL